MMTFIEALKQGNLQAIKDYPKAELHNHATRGGNIKEVLKESNEPLPVCPPKLDGLAGMQEWYEQYVKIHISGRDGFERRIKAAFLAAKENHVTDLVLSFGLMDACWYEDDIQKFISRIKEMKQETYPEVHFIPELSYARQQDPQKVLSSFQTILPFKFFQRLDLGGDEFTGVDDYVPLYQLAKENGFTLLCHVGEFSGPEYIKDAILKLNLDEVHHGIRAYLDKDVMDLIKDREIILNICPSSNVILGNTLDYKTHPIGILYRHGIHVTINSDDYLIFNQSVSEDYLHLYQNENLTASELEEIRLFGLTHMKKN